MIGHVDIGPCENQNCQAYVDLDDFCVFCIRCRVHCVCGHHCDGCHRNVPRADYCVVCGVCHWCCPCLGHKQHSEPFRIHMTEAERFNRAAQEMESPYYRTAR